MLRPVPVLACLAGLLTGAGPAPAQAPGPAAGGDEVDLVRKVNRAIDRGTQYLRSIHNKSGNGQEWEGFWISGALDMNGGVTALGALALLNCGEKPDAREVRSALDYLRKLPPAKTYVVGLSTMAFAEARQPKDLPLIQRNVDWLVKTATRDGGKIAGWSYPVAPDGGGRPDGSNTQYALLGLYAGKQAGARIDDEVWRQVRQLYLASQRKDGPDAGFWTYVEERAGPLSGPSFTMTVAGVCGLLIAGLGLDESQQGLDPATGVAARCGRYDSNDPLVRGLNWVGKHFSFTRAPGVHSSVYYNIYGIERAGRLSGQRFLGRVDWYREGCEHLVREQAPEGFWQQKGGIGGIDSEGVISTSFALLFLAKGRTPVLLSKLAWGEFAAPAPGMVAERGDEAGVIGWDRKHNDARNLTDFAARELFNGLPLGWQVYDPRRREFPRDEDIAAEVGVLVQSPVLYLTGHDRPRLTGQQKKILKRYVEEGGFVLGEACCGSEEFAAGFRDLMREVFPESPLKPVPPEHPVWRSFYAVPPTEFPTLEGMDRGCRTVAVFSPQPLAGFWEEGRFAPHKGRPAAKPGDQLYRGEQAYRLAGNVIAYATGMEPPKQRLTAARIAQSGKTEAAPPKGFLKPAQVKVPGEAPPAPHAMRNVMAHLRQAARVDVVLDAEQLTAGDDDLFKYKFLYLHGRRRFEFTPDEVDNLKTTLQTGGVLLADACCGKPEFDAGFRALVEQAFGRKLEPIPADDELFSAKLNGAQIATVKRREKAGGAGPDGGYQDLPPQLEGVKVDGRWAVIYSRYDIGCALERHRSTDCLGHDPDSALKLATAAVLYALKR